MASILKLQTFSTNSEQFKTDRPVLTDMCFRCSPAALQHGRRGRDERPVVEFGEAAHPRRIGNIDIRTEQDDLKQNTIERRVGVSLSRVEKRSRRIVQLD